MLCYFMKSIKFVKYQKINIMNENKENKLYKYSLIALGVILLVVAILFYKEYRENRKHIQEISAEKVNLENELKLLAQDYDALQTSNDTLNVKLKVEQEKITNLLQKMKVFKNNSYAEINRYKRQIGNLKQVLRNYVVQIDSLNTRNKLLTAENNRVKKQINWVKEQNKKLEKSSEDMKELINKASTLSIVNLVCQPINKRGRIVRKLKKTKKLRTSFTVNKNITAKTGAKQFFVRITRPDDVVLGNPENLLFDFENTKLIYSAKREIDYEGNTIDVAIFWDNDNSLIKGTYRVDVFADGKQLNTTTFYLK